MADTTRPAIPTRVRTVTYFVLLGVAAAVLGVETIAPIWLDADTADQLARTAGAVLAVVSLVGGGLGVTYRPTRPDALTRGLPTPRPLS